MLKASDKLISRSEYNFDPTQPTPPQEDWLEDQGRLRFKIVNRRLMQVIERALVEGKVFNSNRTHESMESGPYTIEMWSLRWGKVDLSFDIHYGVRYHPIHVSYPNRNIPKGQCKCQRIYFSDYRRENPDDYDPEMPTSGYFTSPGCEICCSFDRASFTVDSPELYFEFKRVIETSRAYHLYHCPAEQHFVAYDFDHSDQPYFAPITNLRHRESVTKHRDILTEEFNKLVEKGALKLR